MISSAEHTYTPSSWPEPLQGDLMRPDGVVRPPVVVVIHGGGWRSGSRHSGYVQRINQEVLSAGYAVFNVSYRFAPNYRFPAQLEDITQAITWLQQEGEALGVDTQRVALWGYSAGAHLASLAAMKEQALPIRAVIAGGTPADLQVWPRSPMVMALIGQSKDEAPIIWAKASPVTQVSTKTPPHFLYHGRWDTLVAFEQALKLEAALQAKGVPVQLVARPMYGHLLTAALPGSSYRQATAFLAQYLR
ncbi:MAG: alpha/beta hydrolase [Moraxellaceae bacterium]|nr:alpha/beta hydrolase [Moraxellaceae bacterium]MDP1776481.1 alpha/beta hydrolase [Moraxellaceae bacterium]MDZ4296899.1 alpha/beta hydrolase [Moraxellaceae bacterium]MDZ4387582.1 alpha/beta hydrolase [Moraxellaceae bacterium]